MMSYSDLSGKQRAMLAVGSVAVGLALGVLLTISDVDLTPLKTLRAVQTGAAGAVVETHYNPLGIIGLSIVGLSIVAAMAFLVTMLRPLLNATGFGSRDSAKFEKVSQQFERELGKVLALIRQHIASNDSYAKSLSNAQSRLTVLPEAEQVRVIVSLLVAENERMRRDSGELKTKLEASKQQVESLRSSLSRAEEVVLKDPLTGVGNRRQFDVTIQKAFAEAQKSGSALSLIMCDIDHFKRVNDAFGHQVGDEIIKMFSRVIESNVREGDTVIRYGGEEFAVILPNTDQASAASVAERIRRQFESKKLTIRESNQKIGQMTASFGVAQHRAGDDSEALVQRSDTKLYDAKAAGRNRVAIYGQI